jgi:hypothetical protein
MPGYWPQGKLRNLQRPGGNNPRIASSGDLDCLWKGSQAIRWQGLLAKECAMAQVALIRKEEGEMDGTGACVPGVLVLFTQKKGIN